MSKAVVAVVGRPNVGKSTLFNKIVGRRVSIVEDSPGVTRDRVSAEAEWTGRRFIVIDTGGIDTSSKDAIPSMMRAQAETAIDLADAVLFVTDGRSGVSSADREIAAILRRKAKKVVLVVNKSDTGRPSENFYDFYELGLGDPVPVSAANMLGLGDMLDKAVGLFPKNFEEEGEEPVNIALIGKPNVGKSSIVNAILGEERVIVSSTPGTTRDSVDSEFEKDGAKYVLIDTAGIRRRSKVTGDIEKYSVIRAIASVERSDVAVLVIDAEEGVTEQDKKIAGLAHEAGKGIVVAVNKWDLIPKKTDTMRDFEKNIRSELSFMDYAPIVFTSAVKGQRLEKLLEKAKKVSENRAARVSTGQLNSLLQDAMLVNPPPSDKGKRLRIYYATQIGVKPPLFCFYVNDRDIMHFSYSRYLENKIREGYDFEGTSIKFVFRNRSEKDGL